MIWTWQVFWGYANYKTEKRKVVLIKLKAFNISNLVKNIKEWVNIFKF